MSLIKTTWAQLIEEIERFEKAELIDTADPVQLKVGGGNATKHVTGYILSSEGLTLIVSGNEKAVTPRKAIKGKVGLAEPA